MLICAAIATCAHTGASCCVYVIATIMDPNIAGAATVLMTSTLALTVHTLDFSIQPLKLTLSVWMCMTVY